MKNRLAPINRIPPEVLTLIPDWDTDYNDQGVIALTHVCRAWREVFISRSSLWTDFDCVDADKTRVYLERSKSCPINLRLQRMADSSPNDPSLPPHDPFFQVIPRAIGRLKSLFIGATPGNLQEIIDHLSHPAPLLDELSINGGFEPQRNAVLTAALFNGNLSSLHFLLLRTVRTQLPWRNMVNLTSFMLSHPPPGGPSIVQLLDFFESAPRLLDIQLHPTTWTSGAPDGRLVSLPCLKKMGIIGEEPSSLLLNHLLIPVGARLTTQIAPRGSLIEDHLPRSLNNLKNLSNFTRIRLCVGGPHPHMRFTGPNGQVAMFPVASPVDPARLELESLVQFDTSEAERLDIDHDVLSSIDLLYQALLPMKNLRTLTLSKFSYVYATIHFLHLNLNLSRVVVCPKLVELILVPHTNGEGLDIRSVVDMAAARAARGAKLSTVRIVAGQEELDPRGVSELRKYVSHVEYGLDVGDLSDNSDSDEDEDSDDSDEDSDGSDEED